MRRLVRIAVLSALAFTLLHTEAGAQSRAFGVRCWNGLEISYQHDLYPGFLEVDLGVMDDEFAGLRLGVSYDFTLLRVGFLGGTVSCYAGPAALLGLHDRAQFIAGVGVAVGAEYLLPHLPLVLSLDCTPAIWSAEGSSFAPRTLIPLAGIKWRF